MTEFGAAAASEVGFIGVAIAAVVLAFSTVANGIRRFRDRKKRVGERAVNDRVTLLFFEDRVELRGRRMFSKQLGAVIESHPLTEVGRPEPSIVEVAGTPWTLSFGYSKDIDRALSKAGVALPEE